MTDLYSGMRRDIDKKEYEVEQERRTREIAGALVKANVLLIDKGGRYYIAPLWEIRFDTAAEAIADWRVAGPCLERNLDLLFDQHESGVYYAWSLSDGLTFESTSLPHAICEAFAVSAGQ